MTKISERHGDSAQIANHGFSWGAAIGGLIGAVIAGQNLQIWDVSAIGTVMVVSVFVGGLLGHWVAASVQDNNRRCTDETWLDGALDLHDFFEIDD